MKQNDIFMIYGNDPYAMTTNLLESLDLVKTWDKDLSVAIKPNLVVAKPNSSGATTSPDIVEAIVVFLKKSGFKNICIMESSWVGDSTKRAFKVCGYETISKKHGVELIDLKSDDFYTVDIQGYKLNICSKIKEIDYIINVPVLKGHCQTLMTCALKNMKGVIPDNEKRRFHTLGLFKPIAYLNKAVKTDLVIVDAMNGDLDFEEGGNPVTMNRIFAGRDPVLTDTFAASLMGFEVNEIPYITIAGEIGAGNCELNSVNLVELNKDGVNRDIRKSRRVLKLMDYVEDRDSCSACCASLVHALARLEDEGFLNHIDEKIYIGQRFKNTQMDNFGVGNCTSGFKSCVPGCPPNAAVITKKLREYFR